MKYTVIDNLKNDDLKKYEGVNYLKGLIPDVRDENGEPFFGFRLFGAIVKDSIKQLGDPFNPTPYSGHVDIETDSCTMTYELGEERTIDRVMITGFFDGLNDYCISEYELYFSDAKDTLFSKENRAIVYKSNQNFKPSKERRWIDQVFLTEGLKARFFGMKILKANPTDDIIRLSTVGLYNELETKQKTYYAKNFQPNFLKGILPVSAPDKMTGLSYLSDGICFDDQKTLTVQEDDELIYQLDDPAIINAAIIVGSQGAIRGCRIFVANTPEKIAAKVNECSYSLSFKPTNHTGAEAGVLTFDKPKAGRYICFKFHKGNLCELGVESDSRLVKVDTDRVITEEFHGFGCNCLPMALMPESLGKGYSETLWELDKRRIINTRPNVIRLWFQLDWLITTRENYENGIYDFDSQKMQSVYHYLDAFKTAGTEIEFNFGWKISKEVAKWFSIPGYERPQDAAPADLNLFAKCCSATLKELIQNRGYSNIKYLTFYNEPNYGMFEKAGDFWVPDHDPQPYYLKLLKTVTAQLRSDGIRDLVKLWGAEQSGSNGVQLDWTKYMTENASDEIDVNTHHRYSFSYQELMDFFKAHKEAAKGGKMVISEYGVSQEYEDWDHSHVAYAMAVHNSGYNGALLWTMHGVCITDPCLFLMDNYFDLWGCLVRDDKAVNRVNGSFYETCLEMRYIPAHSKAISVKTNSDDVRAAAFLTPDGGMTVMAEVKESLNGRSVEIQLSRDVNRDFYKHTYKKTVNRNGNCTVIPSDGKVHVKDSIRFETNSAYQMVMFTTLPPIKQVELDAVEVHAKASGSVQLHATLLDAEGQIEWSVASSTGALGSVNKNGLYTADKAAKPGDVIAVRAGLRGEPLTYAIAIVRIDES